MEIVNYTKTPKVAIYCRLSDEDRNKKNPEEDSRSIQTQKSMLRDYAAEQGWEIYDVYSDDDYSGADSNRPEYNRLLADAEARKFDIVLCKHQSRFTRDMVHVETYINEKFKEWGIRYVSLLDGADTALVGNKKSRQINGLVNEWYLEDLSENMRKAYATRKKEGKYLASCPVYGYKKDPENSYHLIIDEPAAEVVRRIFDMYLTGHSMNVIARTLNAEGIPTPTKYKIEVQGINFKGTENLRKSKRFRGETVWQSSSINRILKNEIYTGGLYQNRQRTISYKNHNRVLLPREDWIIVENTHEPIISRNDFERAKYRNGKPPRVRVSENGSFFSGKLVCGYCGGAVVSNSCRGDVYRYYRCSRQVNLKNCSGVSVSEKLLKDEILKELKQIIRGWFTEEELNQVTKRVKLSRESSLDSLEMRLKEKQYEKEKLIEKKASLYTNMMDGIISAEDYRELSEHFRKKQDQLQQEIDATEAALEMERIRVESREKKECELQRLVKGSVEDFLLCEELTEEMLQTFVDYVEVRNGPKNGVKKLTIHWTF